MPETKILQKYLPNSTSGVPAEKKLQNGYPRGYQNDVRIQARTTLGDPRTTLGDQSRPRYPQDLKKRGPRPENDVLEGLKSIRSTKNTFRKHTNNWPSWPYFFNGNCKTLAGRVQTLPCGRIQNPFQDHPGRPDVALSTSPPDRRHRPQGLYNN